MGKDVRDRSYIGKGNGLFSNFPTLLSKGPKDAAYMHLSLSGDICAGLRDLAVWDGWLESPDDGHLPSHRAGTVEIAPTGLGICLVF